MHIFTTYFHPFRLVHASMRINDSFLHPIWLRNRFCSALIINPSQRFRLLSYTTYYVVFIVPHFSQIVTQIITWKYRTSFKRTFQELQSQFANFGKKLTVVALCIDTT